VASPVRNSDGEPGWQTIWKGENQLPKVIQGVTFRDGIEVSVPS
jgi:hypothetical protein